MFVYFHNVKYSLHYETKKDDKKNKNNTVPPLDCSWCDHASGV